MADFLTLETLSPGTFTRFTFTRAHQGLVPLARTVALVGIQTGAAPANVPVAVTSPDRAAELFGVGSELSLMVAKAFEAGALFGQMPHVLAVPLAAPAAPAAAAIYRLSFGGAATRAGVARVRVAGVEMSVPVNLGDTGADLASALVAALPRYDGRLPVTGVDSGNGVARFTHRSAGVNGNDVVLEVRELPAGLSGAPAQVQAGTGTADLAVALANLLAFDVNTIAVANHTPADVRAGNDHAREAWLPAQKRWRHVFHGTTGDNTTAGQLAQVNRFWSLVIAAQGSPSLPSQIAAVAATLATATANPNYNWTGYDGLPLVAPGESERYTPTEVEEALQLGVTPLVAVPGRGDRMAFSRLVTTQVSLDGVPSKQLADFSVSDTSAYVARQLDAAQRTAFGPRSTSPRRITPDLKKQVRDVVIARLRSMEKAGILRNVAGRLGELTVTESTARGRLVVKVPEEPTPQLQQLLFDINVFS